MLKTNPTKKKVQIEGIKKPKNFKKCIKEKAYQPTKSQTSYNKHNGWANFKTVSCTIHIMHTNFNKNPIRALEKDPTFHNGNHNKYTKKQWIYIYIPVPCQAQWLSPDSYFSCLGYSHRTHKSS